MKPQRTNPHLVEKFQRHLVDLGVDRHSYVVAIGGGAVLDLIGFVAATTHRGIRHIRIPTTVLAQNDSGIGVKNGVNGFGIKNLLGCFEPPAAVINNSAFIDVLPGRDKRAGMAEAVKVALISDARFFDWLEEQAEALALFASEPLDRLIRHCAMLHMRQIAQGGDPFERGSARPLDFGHWAAHKLETLSGYELRHGEAVAIGIALDTRYSVLAGLLPEGDDVRVRRLLERLGFALWHEACEFEDPSGKLLLLRGLEDFREHLGGELTVTLLSSLGTGVEVHAMDERLIAEAIAWLRPEARRLMQLSLPGDPHLTYCTNIHAGETWPEIETALGRFLPVHQEPHFARQAHGHRPQVVGDRRARASLTRCAVAPQGVSCRRRSSTSLPSTPSRMDLSMVSA